MKNVLRKVVFAVLLLPILIVLIAFLLPSHYKVERSIVIKSSATNIFPYLNDLRRWPEWTAWTSNREPSLVYSYSGPTSGPGAVQSWTARSGNGTIQLTAADPNEGIRYQLNFNEGRFISTGHIQLIPSNSNTTNSTSVIWSTEGDLGKNPVGRYLGLMMDKWMGADFEAGLQNLKNRIEPRSNR